MAPNVKTRRLAVQGAVERVSELMLCGVTTEDNISAAEIQMNWLRARYPVGESLARQIAEHAFARRAQ